MTEYAAIRIVFTLQGLYTCTHSNRCQPEARRLTSRHRSTENKNSQPWLHPAFPGLGAFSRKRLLRDFEAI